MSIQLAHIVSPTDIGYYEVDTNKVISDLEIDLTHELDTKAIIRGCNTSILNRLWPLKFYDDTFYIETQQKYTILFDEFDGESYEVYLNPKQLSHTSVRDALHEQIGHEKWIIVAFNSFYLHSTDKNVIIFRQRNDIVYYKINIHTVKDDEPSIETKDIMFNQGCHLIRDLLKRINISGPIGSIESWVYKIDINDTIITDIDKIHPKSRNNMNIYIHYKKYIVKYYGIEYTGDADDILIHPCRADMLVRKGTTERLTSMKFGDICDTCIKTELEFYYNPPSNESRESIFIKSLTGKTITFRVDLNISVDELGYIIYCREGISPNQQRLIYSGRLLESGTLRENKLVDGSTIHLVLRLRGGGSDEFIDISKGMKAHSFSKSGPHWFSVHSGLFLRGYCGNSNCKAYEEYVVINKIHESFDLRYDKYNPKNICPECKSFVTVKSFGFNRCRYKIDAEFTNGEKKTIIDSTTDGYVEPDVTSSDDTAEYTKFTLSATSLHGVFEVRYRNIEVVCGEKKMTAMINKYTKCPICHDILDTNDKKISITDCNHIYCKECISTWLEESNCNKCPMCRTNIETVYS